MLTPRDIHEAEFKRVWRGYDPEEVDDFLRRVVVEYEPQSRIEGEVQQLDRSFPVIEFADVVSGKVRARENDRQVTIFDSVGFALEDFSSLRYLERLHREIDIEPRELDLIPAPKDPKDLFNELAPVVRPAARMRAV